MRSSLRGWPTLGQVGGILRPSILTMPPAKSATLLAAGTAKNCMIWVATSRSGLITVSTSRLAAPTSSKKSR